MGLLDLFDNGEAQFGLGLLAAAAPRADGAGFGQRLMEGVNHAQQWKQDQTKQKLYAMQMEEAQMKMEEAKRQQAQAAEQRQWVSNLPGVMGQKVYGSSDQGPTQAPDTAALNRHLLSPDSPFADKLLERQLFPKETEGFTLSEGQSRFGPNGKLIVQGTAKPEDKDPKIKQYEYAKTGGYKGTFEQFVTLGPALMAAASAPLRDAQINNITSENAYNLPPPRAPQAQAGNFSVSVGGKIYLFPDQKSANSFKMKAGVK